MRSKQIAAGIALGLVVVAASAKAAVVESNTQGFAIEERAHIASAPDQVYAALIHPESWWNAQHTFSHDAKNLSLDAKANGCLCETLPNGGSVRHLTVILAAPGSALRLTGAMGPFQSEGVASTLTFTLTAKDGGTDLLLENNVGGFIKGGFGKWQQAADGMLSDLVEHLKYYAENGKSEPPPAK